MKLKCKCGKELNIPENYGHQKGKCPNCGNIITLQEKEEIEKPQKKSMFKISSIISTIIFIGCFLTLRECSKQGVKSLFTSSKPTEYQEENEVKKIFNDAMKEAIEELENEETPRIDQPIKITRKKFHLSFPGNWKENKKAKDYLPENRFVLEGSGIATIQFYIDIKEDIEDIEKQINENFQKINFKQWGKYTGHGIETEVKLMGMICYLRTFVASNKKFAIIEMAPTKSKKTAKPGFELISSTFEIKD